MILIFLIYNIFFIPVVFIIKSILRLFNSKLNERESNISKSHESLKILTKSNSLIWFHASSMGEFEQAKPVIENIIKYKKDISIVVSFYSPSGYNNQKNYKYANSVVYMPFDSYFSAKRFINTISPDLAIFVRYDYWFNHLFILKKSLVPVVLINATAPIRKGLLFNYYYKNVFSLFTKIYTGGESHYDFFNSLIPDSDVIPSSDTRYDRIIENVSQSKDHNILNKIKIEESSFVLIVGSCWEPDESLLIEPILKLRNLNISLTVIWVPHEPTELHVRKLKSRLPSSILLSELDDINEVQPYDIIVDSVGKLLSLYSIADAAIVGGGFGAGIHSLAEPAGYGIPLACGPNYKFANDANELKQIGSLEILQNNDDATDWLSSIILDKKLRKERGLKAKQYIENNSGSTNQISNDLINLLLNSHKPVG